MPNYEKVLLLTTNHVGNNIFCTPAIHLLKKHWPHTKLDVVTMSARGADVFAANPDINKIYTTTRKRKFNKIAALYPLVIGLHHDKANKYLQALPVKSIAIGASRGKHRAEEALEFIQGLLQCPIQDSDRHYVLPPQAQHRAEIKKQLIVSAQDILVGLHLGCGRTAVHGWKIWYKRRDVDPKLWPLEQYIALAKLLINANPRIRLVITGSRNEKFLGKQFVKQIPGTINLMGKTSLFSLAALMQHLRVFITQDTGALHVACSTDVPLIGLFGPTNPVLTGPFPLQPQHVILKKNTMQEIVPEEVCKATLEKIV